MQNAVALHDIAMPAGNILRTEPGRPALLAAVERSESAEDQPVLGIDTILADRMGMEGMARMRQPCRDLGCIIHTQGMGLIGAYDHRESSTIAGQYSAGLKARLAAVITQPRRYPHHERIQILTGRAVLLEQLQVGQPTHPRHRHESLLRRCRSVAGLRLDHSAGESQAGQGAQYQPCHGHHLECAHREVPSLDR